MKIYLVQHGKAYTKEEDPERRLTEEGIKETEKIAKYLYEVGVKPRKILHSGKTRARMTAEILSKYLGVDNVEETKGINPLDEPDIIIEKLEEIDYDVMIVGHLPHLSRLTSKLLGSEGEIVKFRYSGVLSLKKTEEGYRIEWYITPDLIP